MLKDPGRRRTIKGFVFEATDQRALDALAKITFGRTRTLVLNGAHNTRAIDGHYVDAARRSGGAAKAATKAKHASHKCSANGNVHKTAASKLKHDPKLLAETEAVVPRGAGKTAKKALGGKMDARESARSVKEVETMTKKAADPRKAQQVGRTGAKKATATALGKAGLASAAVSLAFDAPAVIKGDKSVGEAAENMGWAGAEGVTTAAAVMVTTAAAAPVILATTAALTASSVAGTTALAGVLVATGPIGLTIATGLAVGWCFGKIRTSLRG